MKQPPAIKASIFEDDWGSWRIYEERDTSHMDDAGLDEWFAEGHVEADLEPKLDRFGYDEDRDAQVAVLEAYIAEFADEYHPQLYVSILDEDDDEELLERLRKEARTT